MNRSIYRLIFNTTSGMLVPLRKSPAVVASAVGRGRGLLFPRSCWLHRHRPNCRFPARRRLQELEFRILCRLARRATMPKITML